MPRRQRRAGARRHAGRDPRRVPGAGVGRVVPLGVSRFNPEPAMRPHTTAEAAAVVDAVEDWQDVYAGRARPPARPRRRRVLPDGRRPFPRRRPLRGLPDARGRHRHGPHVRARVHRPASTTSTGSAGASSPPSTPALADATRRLHRPAVHRRDGAGRARPRRRAPIGILTGELGAKVSPLVARASAATTSASSRSPTSSSAATPASPG